jgi:hypothetical protein
MRRLILLAFVVLGDAAWAGPLPRTGDYLDTAYIEALQKTHSP